MKYLAILAALACGSNSWAAGPGEAGDSPLGLETHAQLREEPFAQTRETDSFWQAFFKGSRNEMQYRIFDIVNPFSVGFHETLSRDPENEFILNRSVVVAAVKVTAREMLVNTALVDDLQDSVRYFIEGSIGNTAEERVSVHSHPTLQYSDESWREEIEDKKFEWGYRLLRWPNPYVYVAGKLGHYDGEEIALWHIRYYLEQFQHSRIEAMFSMPLPERVFLSMGMVYASADKYRELGRTYFASLRLDRWWVSGSKISGLFVGSDIAQAKSVTLGGFFEY